MSELWPAHFEPAHDELFTSWVTRLASANGLMAPTFARTILSGSLSISDSDVVVPERMAKALSIGTGVSDAAIRGLGISSREDILGSVEENSGVRPWLLPLRVGSRKRWRKALQICPACLNSFGYFRQTWRLAFVTCCTIHRVYLLDQCTGCGSRIRIWQYKNDLFGRRLDLALVCYRCKLPFGEQDGELAPSVAIAAQEALTKAFATRSAVAIGLFTFDARGGFAFIRRSLAIRTRSRVPSIEFQSLAMRRLSLASWNELIISVPINAD
jgi:hypothetical protein